MINFFKKRIIMAGAFLLVSALVVGFGVIYILKQPSGSKKDTVQSTKNDVQNEITEQPNTEETDSVDESKRAVEKLVTITPPQSIFSKGLFELGFSPALKELPVKVATAKNLNAIVNKYLKGLSPEQRTYLDAHHFVLVPMNQTKFNGQYTFDDFLAAYDTIRGVPLITDRSSENAKLVTPDLVLHAYHRFFENTMEILEKNDLTDTLQAFLDRLYENIKTGSAASSGELKTHYDLLLAQITVAKVLLENKLTESNIRFEDRSTFSEKDKTVDSLQNAMTVLKKYRSALPEDLAKAVETELGSIYEHTGVGMSPLFNVYNKNSPSDYTQYSPRSHYNKTSALRAYFRTMMYLGRSSYNLKTDYGVKDANLLTALIKKPAADGIAPYVSWKKIMDITGFYAGQSDDLTFLEWNDYLNGKVGQSVKTMSDLLNTNLIGKMNNDLSSLRLPRILSEVIIDDSIVEKDKNQLLKESLSFRIFGQRFTYDAWILNQLTKGQEKGPKLPSTPSALFVPATLGNQTAMAETVNFLRKSDLSGNDITVFKSKVGELSKTLEAVGTTEWYSSLQSAWDFTFGSMLGKYGLGYPAYMRDIAFPYKEIQTILGSYTELKHDTVLYAKQSYAELGAGPGDEKPIPPVVRGFVEPNLIFWRRISALVDYTQAIFKQYDLFKDESVSGALDSFKDDVDMYSSLAEKELRGVPISDEEYEKLRVTNLSYFARPFDSVDPDENSYKTALVTDVHTDALKYQILYEATGEPYMMIALVGNENDPRAVIGPVFNHFEFTDPIGSRLTDEDWRAKVYTSKPELPPKNSWYAALQP